MQPEEDYERWRRLSKALTLPCAVVDLDALEANVQVLLGRLAGPTTLRLASKSVRVPSLLRHVAGLDRARMRGLMTYSARETKLLADQGFDDFILAYPVATLDDARILVDLGRRDVSVRAVVDCDAHIELIAKVASGDPGRLSLCLDVDVSWRLFAGRLHLGVRRSPLRTPEQALALADHARRLRLPVTAVMGYEAQVAGMREDNPGSRHLDPVRRFIRERSKPLAAQRRKALVDALRAAGVRIDVVNGGGTGSIDSTSADGSVTEVTAGSGFFAPHLFDGYRGLVLSPAAFFVLPVVRFPDPDWVTCAGGGYLASGPGASDRAPIVHLPRGLKPTDTEGFGEVQTPLQCSPDAPRLGLGDPVICRHAKAGELFERFAEVYCVRGAEVISREATYRGLAGAFG